MARKKPTPPPEEGPEGRGRPRSRPGPPVDPSEEAGEPEPTPPPSPPSPKRGKRARSSRALVSPESALASKLANQAAEALEPGRRTTLARRAIALDPDCVEAYLVLAEMAVNRKEAIALFEQAVESSGRSLGTAALTGSDEVVWHIGEARRYMRARLGLAEALWGSGRRAEAAGHLDAMLRLNPGDDQGLRYIQAGWLLNLDRLDELGDLLARYDEDSTTWSYTRALVAYRRGGDSAEARALFKTAKKANKHVPGYLIGREPLPPDQPTYYSPGDEEDAILYVGHNLSAWKSVPGAIGWVRLRVKAPRRRKPKAPATVGPSPESEEKLRDLPSEMDAWQADFRQFARRVEIAGERVRPWMVLVSSRTRDLVLAHALIEQAPSPDELWDIVAGAMVEPAAGEPHRPTEIQVRPGDHWDALARHFEAIGVSCSAVEVLDQVDTLFDDLGRHMAGVDPPGLLDMPGVVPDQVARFYEAAAAFYRRAPWRALGFEAVVRVESDRYQSGPWFAVIMGQSGLTLGLALYEDLDLLRRMWAGGLSDEEGARLTVALTVTFDDDSTMIEADLESIETQGWPIAAPEAHPSLFRKERGLSMRPPLAWEIDLMTACLIALPDFIDRRQPDDPTRELVSVPIGVTTTELGLSWIEEPN